MKNHLPRDFGWGYSGRVGEWNVRLGGSAENLGERLGKLTQLIDRLLLPVSSLHRLHRARVDLSILDAQLCEERFLEDVELKVTELRQLSAALRQLATRYPRTLITRLDLDLDTWVLLGAKKVLIPQSAELYIGSDEEVSDGQEAELFVSYSTLIDVWLSKTLGEFGEVRDNSRPSEQNSPRLQRFLELLAQNLGRSLELGESVYYSDYLHKTGFRQNHQKQVVGHAKKPLLVNSPSLS